jgi:hypothetical protein
MKSAGGFSLLKLCGLIVFCSALALGLFQLGSNVSSSVLAPGAARAADPPVPILVREGLGKGFPCEPDPDDPYCVNGELEPPGNAWPADVNGDVGLNHYVEAVNAHFAVFNKATGDRVGRAVRLQKLWQGQPSHGCATSPVVDPWVRFDRFAGTQGRWVIAYTAKGVVRFQCFAVSQSSDPTQQWHTYAIDVGAFDYTKIGLWPTGHPQTDAYYVTFSQSGSTKVCALERLKMVTGDPARHVCASIAHSWIHPSDTDGRTPPGALSPNYLVALTDTDSSALLLWKAQVDWNPVTVTPTLTVTGPAPLSLSVDPYTRLVADVPQPDVGPSLQSQGNKVMPRFAYRRFATHESFVVTHAVDADAGSGVRGGVRWYELRCVPVGSCEPTSAVPSVYRQDTYAPLDGSCGVANPCWRWMGSGALDGAGNLALGYNVASSSAYAGIRFTGIDKNGGQLPEGVIQAGQGKFTGYRWGDFVTMSIDSSDECTFWYTNQYGPAASPTQWVTKVAKFKLDEAACMTP